MKGEIEAELKVAEERLESANILFRSKKWSDAVSRAYYSMYHAAKALLRIYGKDPKTHEGLITEFGLTFIKTGLLDKKYGIMLRKAQEAGESSDYKIFVVFGEDEVGTMMNNAKVFLDMAQRFSKELIKGKKFPND